MSLKSLLKKNSHYRIKGKAVKKSFKGEQLNMPKEVEPQTKRANIGTKLKLDTAINFDCD